MPSRKLEDLHPTLVEAFNYAKEEFTKKNPSFPIPIITCTYRNDKEQDELFAQGRTKPGKIVTKAKAGQSPHNQLPAKAFDIAFQSGQMLDWNEKYFKKFAEILLQKYAVQVKWGGTFISMPDRPHFELIGWNKNLKKS